MKKRIVREVDDLFAHEWIVPTFPWIDQLKEIQAQGSKLDRGVTTHSRICKSLGYEREDIVAARKREILDAIEISKGIEKETGVKVPWQIFAGMDVPGKSTNIMALAALGEQEKSSPGVAPDEEEE